MELYYVKRSGPSARVVAVLHALGLPYEAKALDPRAGQNKLPEYLQRNPMGKVPTLVDGSTVLWESTAIAWYLAEKYGAGKLLPSTIEGRADVMRWIAFLLSHVGPAQSGAFYNTVGAAFFGRTPDEKALAHAHSELQRFLPVLDEQLSTREWLAGKLSVADLVYAPGMVHLELAKVDLAPWPHLQAWAQRLAAHPSVRHMREAIGL